MVFHIYRKTMAFIVYLWFLLYIEEPVSNGFGYYEFTMLCAPGIPVSMAL